MFSRNPVKSFNLVEGQGRINFAKGSIACVKVEYKDGAFKGECRAEFKRVPTNTFTLDDFTNLDGSTFIATLRFTTLLLKIRVKKIDTSLEVVKGPGLVYLRGEWVHCEYEDGRIVHFQNLVREKIFCQNRPGHRELKGVTCRDDTIFYQGRVVGEVKDRRLTISYPYPIMLKGRWTRNGNGDLVYVKGTATYGYKDDCDRENYYSYYGYTLPKDESDVPSRVPHDLVDVL